MNNQLLIKMNSWFILDTVLFPSLSQYCNQPHKKFTNNLLMAADSPLLHILILLGLTVVNYIISHSNLLHRLSSIGVTQSPLLVSLLPFWPQSFWFSRFFSPHLSHVKAGMPQSSVLGLLLSAMLTRNLTFSFILMWMILGSSFTFLYFQWFCQMFICDTIFGWKLKTLIFFYLLAILF